MGGMGGEKLPSGKMGPHCDRNRLLHRVKTALSSAHARHCRLPSALLITEFYQFYHHSFTDTWHMHLPYKSVGNVFLTCLLFAC